MREIGLERGKKSEGTGRREEKLAAAHRKERERERGKLGLGGVRDGGIRDGAVQI